MLIFWIIYFFMLGATFASFYNVVGIRAIDKISLTRRSQCPKCNNKLRFIDVIPIFGFLINRGRCHFCKGKIHIKYLLIEVFGGLMFVCTYLKFPIHLIGFKWELLIYLLLMSLIMTMVMSFYEHGLILKKVVYVALFIFIMLSIFNNDSEYLLKIFPKETGFLSSAIGMGIAILLTFLLSLVNERTKHYILYAGALGCVLGFFGTAVAVILFGITYLIVKICRKEALFVYLASLACIASLFASPYIFECIQNIIG